MLSYDRQGQARQVKAPVRVPLIDFPFAKICSYLALAPAITSSCLLPAAGCAAMRTKSPAAREFGRTVDDPIGMADAFEHLDLGSEIATESHLLQFDLAVGADNGDLQSLFPKQ